MRRLAAVSAALVLAACLASGAAAATIYAGPKEWLAGQSAASSYSTGWAFNDFAKYGSGYDTTVTFIDNVTYSWHATVRNSNSTTHTYYYRTGNGRKGHCIAHVSYFWGNCNVYS